MLSIVDPINPLSPNIVISSPESIGLCQENVILDSRLSTNIGFKKEYTTYTWLSVGGPSGPISLSSYLTNESYLIIPVASSSFFVQCMPYTPKMQ